MFSCFVRFLKELPSFTMYLMLSNSAIGMGGSDSRGSIEQSIMDREVISIGGSLLEDTHRSASDNESSSLERVWASGCTSEGASHPHGRVRPFVATKEPIPVTVILPTSALGGGCEKR